MAQITGFKVDHRVNVAGFAGAHVRPDGTVAIYLANEAAPGGHTILTIPGERLELSLGLELAQWLLLALPQREKQGEEIRLSDFIYAEARGAHFRLMVADMDDETVLLSMPLARADEALGPRLCAKLVERGAFTLHGLLRAVNESMSKEEQRS